MLGLISAPGGRPAMPPVQQPGRPALPMGGAQTRFLLPVQQCEFQLTNVLEGLQKDPWPVANDTGKDIDNVAVVRNTLGEVIVELERLLEVLNVVAVDVVVRVYFEIAGQGGPAAAAMQQGPQKGLIQFLTYYQHKV